MSKPRSAGALTAVIGFLAVVELTSGVLQGYYTPLMTDIARHLGIHDADVNWLEGAQLMLSALVVPAFAKLGDMVGHKRMLVVSTAITAVASISLALTDSFWLFLAAWAMQGFYVAWLPLEVALIWNRTRGGERPAARTRMATGILVAFLEIGAIVGALAGGALIDALPLWVVLLIPGLAVAVCFVIVLVGVSESPEVTGGRLDTTGLVVISLALVALTGGLSFIRLNGPGDLLSWGLIALGVLLGAVFARVELGRDDPIIDVRMFRNPALWPVFMTAALFGMSVLGAQAPLSTYARTDPAEVGYGLGTSGFQTSLIIGFYLIAFTAGALLLPLVTRVVLPRVAVITANLVMAVGYGLFVPFHDTYLQVVLNMVVAGLGSGVVMAALPSTAASVAPPTQTGVATGLTNAVKTVGGAIASAVFGIALLGAAGESQAVESTAGTLSGYLTVWIVCSAAALVSAILMLFVPKRAFSDHVEVAG